jgi:hypothetical protein
MENYAVFLQGNDFELTRNGVRRALGFFVTVRVESKGKAEAAKSAIELVKSDPELAGAYRANVLGTPSIEVKVVHQLLPENKMNRTEFFFYSMDEECSNNTIKSFASLTATPLRDAPYCDRYVS